MYVVAEINGLEFRMFPTLQNYWLEPEMLGLKMRGMGAILNLVVQAIF